MRIFNLLFTFLLVTSASQSLAQHQMHGGDGESGISVSTMPMANEVLAKSPEQIMMNFQEPYTLVKLVMKTPDNEFVDINFRFDPTPGMHMVHAIPALEPDDYYEVEWAVLSREGELIRGNFHFSFGEDARPPSYYLDQMEMPVHIMAPDYRLL